MGHNLLGVSLLVSCRTTKIQNSIEKSKGSPNSPCLRCVELAFLTLLHFYITSLSLNRDAVPISSNAGRHGSMSTRDKGIFVSDFMMGAGLKLSGIDLLIYGYTYGLWVNGKVMFASCSSLAKRLGCTREAVNRSLMGLEKAHYIDRLQQKGRYGNNYYTINEDTLNEKLPARCDDSAQVMARCDDSAQDGVTKPHRGVCENRTSPCDLSSQENNKEKNTNYKKGEKCSPPPSLFLPLNCKEDEECKRLGVILMKSPKWASRSPEALVEAARVLEGRKIEVGREMLRHTIEGDYPRIYEPNDEVLKKAESTRCAERSHQAPSNNRAQEVDDGPVFNKLLRFFTPEIREMVYSVDIKKDSNGPQRALQFFQNNGKVLIKCPPGIRSWLETISEDLVPILEIWAGSSYSGYFFTE